MKGGAGEWNRAGRRHGYGLRCTFRLLAVLLGIELLPLAHAAPESAFKERFYNAELIAKVRIASVHRMVDQALSEPGMTAIKGYVYAGVTQKVWRGPAGNLVAFRLSLDACQQKLHSGETYLIFARTDADGRLELMDCSDAVEEGQAASLLAQLNRDSQG